MSSSSPDSHKISLNIINAIKQHPVLYVPEIKGTSVKPQEFRQKVWKRISNELGLDPCWVKFRWKNLRDTYCRILKNKSKGPKRKRWIFEKHLDFLKLTYKENCNYVELSDDYINDINSEDIKSNDIMGQLEENEEDDDYNEFLEVIENDDTTLENSPKQSHDEHKESKLMEIDHESRNKQAIKRSADEDCAANQNVQPKKIKLDFSPTNLDLSKKSTAKNISNQKKIVMAVKKKSFDYDTSIDSFFQNIAQNVKKLPPKVQADIKMDVSKIVSEAEINYFKKDTLEKIQKYSNMPGMIKKLVLVPCHMIDDPLKTDKH